MGYADVIMKAIRLAILVLVAGCQPPWWQAQPLDPVVTFAAHRESRGVVIDRLAGDGSALLIPAGSPWNPETRLEQRHTPVATIYPEGSQATVRSADGATGRLLGHVEAQWDAGAIRFLLRPSTGDAIRTSVFHRLGTTTEPPLHRYAKTVFDLHGDYRADLQDASGTTVGWMRVQVGRYQAYTRIYDGVIPPSVDGALVAAAAQMLDSEIDHIEANASTNVYLN